MGDQKNAPTAGIEPVTSRSLGGHHIHYTTATFKVQVITLAVRNLSRAGDVQMELFFTPSYLSSITSAAFSWIDPVLGVFVGDPKNAP
ncbi:hypothetical protein DPMN_074431 [Dreissena polymorpha]|uniref:Uncharacterized protein n=1 Tax=Dreissena polymorpha TaxID=45954 RepID=A0A9D3YHP9_DREPO|nr:hypothetical protein DPMN_074431 [Dreissena polymorpha]